MKKFVCLPKVADEMRVPRDPQDVYDVLFQDNRSAPTVTITAFDEDRHERQRSKLALQQEADARLVDVDENPVDDRRLKKKLIFEEDEISAATSESPSAEGFACPRSQATIERQQAILKHKQIKNKKFPGHKMEDELEQPRPKRAVQQQVEAQEKYMFGENPDEPSHLQLQKLHLQEKVNGIKMEVADYECKTKVRTYVLELMRLSLLTDNLNSSEKSLVEWSRRVIEFKPELLMFVSSPYRSAAEEVKHEAPVHNPFEFESVFRH